MLFVRNHDAAEMQLRMDEACVFTEELLNDIDEDERKMADEGEFELEEDLYTNALMSLIAPLDNKFTQVLQILLLVCTMMAQLWMTESLRRHIEQSMSWSENSVLKQEMVGLYNDQLPDTPGGRLEFMRLDQDDVHAYCGNFQFDIEERSIPETSWPAFFEYRKVPVDNWKVERIPPVDRSVLDETRYVLNNDRYYSVYIIVSFTWILSTVNEFRLIGQYLCACAGVPVIADMRHRCLKRVDEGFMIAAFTPCAKYTSLAIGFYRFLLTLFLLYVGCSYLMWTTDIVDLILNAVALLFVLEIDHIVYKATVSRARQHLIKNMTNIRWKDPSYVHGHTNLNKSIFLILIIAASCSITAWLRITQYEAYKEKFTVAASICLFQGVTPGYWDPFRASFPVPGFCETVLQLRCEVPLVGEKGKSCYADMSQYLCTYWLRSTFNPMHEVFNTHHSIDWKNQGPCITWHKRHAYSMHTVHGSANDFTHRVLVDTCKAMYNQNPVLSWQGGMYHNSGPRTRTYPLKTAMWAAPFWCPYAKELNGTERIIKADVPLPLEEWPKLLANCGTGPLVYNNNSELYGRHQEAAANEAKEQATRSAGATDMEAMQAASNSSGVFSGLFVGPEFGLAIIVQDGQHASFFKPGATWSPAEAFVHARNITLITGMPGLKGYLDQRDRIVLDTGEILISAQDSAASAQAKRAQQQQQQTTTTTEAPKRNGFPPIFGGRRGGWPFGGR